MKVHLDQALQQLIKVATNHPQVVALVVLGSLSNPRRLDDYSDIDFFMMVEPQAKAAMIKDLTWLNSLVPTYTFQNTRDGYKVLLKSNVFMEFAIFTMDELVHIPYHHPKVVYAKNSEIEKQIPLKETSIESNPNANLQEALTNLYIGLLRHHRGEVLAAYQMIQQYALNHVVQAVRNINPKIDVDPFNALRRLELIDPLLANWVMEVLNKPDQNQEAARKILKKIKDHLEPNSLMQAIENLL
ncbi:MAG: hypothetical protein ACO22H_02680 [Bacilli bacterium]